MPGKDGKLTNSEQEWIIAELNRRFPDHPCPMSKKSDWGVAPYLAQVENYVKKQEIQEERRMYPCIVLICKDCGLTYLFNAYQFGFLKRETEENPNEAGNAG